PVNPLHFSHPSVPRFPAFPVPRHVREQIGAHLYRFRLQCNLLPSSVPRSLRLPLSPLMIASWERGAASPWAIYVDRLSQLAGYTLHAEFVESLQARFAPWLDSDGEARVAQEPTAPQPIPFVPLGFV
ncbi:MAG: hypothetical protein ACRDX8_15375, partial [Acidimicrobiales bacterium]